MASNPRPRGKEEVGWVTRPDAADAIGRTMRNFDNTVRPHIPDAAVRREGRETRYKLRTIVEWHVQNELEKLMKRNKVAAAPAGDALKLDAQTIRDLKAAGLAPEDLALVLGDATPTIDRLRMIGVARGAHALAKERGYLIERSKVREWLGFLSAKLRECGETLRNAYGDDAARLLNVPLDAFEKRVREGTRRDG